MGTCRRGVQPPRGAALPKLWVQCPLLLSPPHSPRLLPLKPLPHGFILPKASLHPARDPGFPQQPVRAPLGCFRQGELGTLRVPLLLEAPLSFRFGVPNARRRGLTFYFPKPLRGQGLPGLSTLGEVHIGGVAWPVTPPPPTPAESLVAADKPRKSILRSSRVLGGSALFAKTAGWFS